MNQQKQMTARHRRKALHVRRTLRSDMERPRLSVFRSRAQTYCQIIDDLAGRTLVAAGTLDRELRETVKGLAKKDAAAQVGEAVAKRALQKGITKVKFDRGWHRYHGRIKALADAARTAGLEF